MDIRFANDEQLVKSWDYASSKEGSSRREDNLTVTNKRVIYTSEGNKGIDRTEMYLSDVKTLSYTYSKVAGIGTWIMLIAGIITAIAIVGIFLIARAISILREKTFFVVITANGFESEGITCGATVFKNRKQKKLKIKIYSDVAYEIINELGAIVASAK